MEACTHGLVTGGHNRDNASLEGSRDSAVDGRGEVTTKGHVHNSLASLAPLLCVVNNELHALKNTGVAATTRSVEHLDGNKVSLLRDTKGSTSDGTSDVAAVAVFVVILHLVSIMNPFWSTLKVQNLTYNIVNEVGSESGTALKLGMAGLDTSIDHICHDTLAS